jgi:small-conductance mechanosensitive channel
LKHIHAVHFCKQSHFSTKRNDMKKIILYTIIYLLSATNVEGQSVIDVLGRTGKSAEVSLATKTYVKIEEKVSKELAELVATKDYVLEIEKVSAELAQAKEAQRRARGSQAQFLERKKTLLNQTLQVLTELEQERQQRISLIEQILKIISDAKADPEFNNLRIPQKASPTFDELQEAARHIFGAQERIAELEKNSLSFTNERNKRLRALISLRGQYKERVQQRETFSEEKNNEGFSRKEQGELLDEQIRQLDLKVKLQEAKVRDAELRVELIDVQLMTLRGQLTVFRDDFNRIKRTVNIDASYVRRAAAELEAKRARLTEERDRINEKIRLISPLKDEIKNQLEQLREQKELSPVDMSSYADWSKEPKTPSDWALLAKVGNFTTHAQVLDAEREFLEAQSSLNRAKLRQEEIDFDRIKSWQKMTQPGVSKDTEEDIDQEIREYGIMKTELQVDYATYADKRNEQLNSLHSLNAILDRIKSFSSQLKLQRNRLATNGFNYNETLNLLYDAEEQLRRRIDLVAKLIEVYSTTMATMQNSIKRIDDVVTELNAKGFWRRSTQSIDWQEARNFIPDLRKFIADVIRIPFKFFSWTHIKQLARSFAEIFTLVGLLILVIRIAMIAIIYLLALTYLPDFRNYLLLISPDYGAFSILTGYTAALLSFILERFNYIYAWAVIFVAIKAEIITDQYFAVLFMVLSIPYLLWLARQLIALIIDLNQRRHYALISQSYEQRFKIILSTLVYSTIVIFFTREAFILMRYPASQVPAILHAINIILLQVACLSFVQKEQVLSLIPTTTPLWEWVRDHVYKYYYFIAAIIVGIIIMSNPYVGYGKQVFYILSRLIITALLIPLFSWLHNRIKRASSDLFFYYSDGETIKERFVSGKTWYGLFVVVTFIGFVIIGILLGAWVWGYSLTLSDIYSSLEYRLYSPGIDEVTGKAIEVTAIQLLKIFLFVLGGLFITFVINHYVLRRIFDPLLVGAGIQNTVLMLTRYAILLIAFVIGMQSAGLDALTIKLGLALGLITYYLKELVLDYFAYFIILIQHPIKIGDWIFLDQHTSGVVRQITPRSTIIRRRNSETLIIPNSQIITKTVSNWNFSRTFFAFDDMFLTVPYSADPAKVKQLILRTLDENGNVLKNPAPIVWLNDFVDNGYQFLIRGYLTADKVLDRWEISSSIRLELVKRLREAGLEVASPTRLLRFAETITEKDIDRFRQDR